MENTEGKPMKYSPYFDTAYDQPKPIGSIGRGTHYSILRCPQWRDNLMTPHNDGGARIQQFAVIWDEDHDERVISVIEEAYFLGLLGPVKFVGERKGSLTVLVDPLFWKSYDRSDYTNKWAGIASGVSGDYWPANVYAYGDPEGEPMIIHDSHDRVATYLDDIKNLWSLDQEQKAYQMPDYAEIAEG